MEVNLDMQSAVISAYENSTFGPYRVIYENEEFLCIHRYVRKQQQRYRYIGQVFPELNYTGMAKLFDMKQQLKNWITIHPKIRTGTGKTTSD